MNVCHYLCFKSDQRASMNVYAEGLSNALSQSWISLRSYQPRSALEAFSSNRVVMRYLRYFQYPRAVSKLNFNADIHHIIDHGYAHLLPRLGAGKKVVTAHDLIPMMRWKGLLEAEDRVAVRKPLLNLHSLSFLYHFDQVIAPSQSTANDLTNHLGIPESKISRVPPVIGAQFGILEESLVAEFSKRYGLQEDCRWIMVSGQEFYKNHVTSLKVLKDLNTQSEIEIRMIKTGLPSEDFNQSVRQLGLEGLVKSLYLEDSKQLALLYNFVDCLLFPSIYEGFGMPVAEALACGTPVVTSDRGALPEVGGELALQFKPCDVKGLSKAIYQILANSRIKSAMHDEGPRWVEQFRPERVAKVIEDVYTRVNQ